MGRGVERRKKRLLCSSSEKGQAKAQTQWTVGSGDPSGVGGNRWALDSRAVV